MELHQNKKHYHNISLYTSAAHTPQIHRTVTRSSVCLGGGWRGHWLSLLSRAQESGSEICGRQYYRTLGHLETSQLFQLMPSSGQVYMCVWRESMCLCMKERRRRARQTKWHFKEFGSSVMDGIGIENSESVEIIFDLLAFYTCGKIISVLDVASVCMPACVFVFCIWYL